MGSNDKGEDTVYGYVDMFKQPGDERPAHIYLLQTKKVRIGREHRCDIRLHSLRVSRLQCCVRIMKGEEGQRVFLQNLSSKATTKYNGEGILHNGQVELSDGDRFQLHDIELRYRAFDPKCPSAQPDPGSGHRVPVIRLRAADRAGTPESCNEDGTTKTPKTEKPKSSRVSARAGRMNKSLGSAGGGSELSAKRRKSSEIDMRKAVLKKTFRTSVQGIKFPQIAETIESSSIKTDSNGWEHSEVPTQDGNLVNTEETEGEDTLDAEAAPGNIHTDETVTENVEEDLILLSPLVGQETTEKNISADVEGDIFEDIEREMFVLHHGVAIGTQGEVTDSSSREDGEDNADAETQQLETVDIPSTALPVVASSDPDLLILVQDTLANSDMSVTVEETSTQPETVPSQMELLQNKDISIVGPVIENSLPLPLQTPHKAVERDVSLFDASATTGKTFCTAFGDDDQGDLSLNTTAKTTNEDYFDAEQDGVENLEDIFENSTSPANKSQTAEVIEIDSDIEEIPQGEEEVDLSSQMTQRIVISPRGSPTKSPSKSPLKSSSKGLVKSPTNSPTKVTLLVSGSSSHSEMEEHSAVDLESSSPDGGNVSMHEFIDLDDSSSDNITGDKSDERLLTGTVPLNLPSIDSDEIIELDQEADLIQLKASSEGSSAYTVQTATILENAVEISDNNSSEIPCENEISSPSGAVVSQLVLAEDVADCEVDKNKTSNSSLDNPKSLHDSVGSREPSSNNMFTEPEISATGADDIENQKLESIVTGVTLPGSGIENEVFPVEDHPGEDEVIETTPQPHVEAAIDVTLETTAARVLRSRRATTDSINSEILPLSTPRRGRSTKNLVETSAGLVKRNAMTTPRRVGESSRTQLVNVDRVRSSSMSEEHSPRGTRSFSVPVGGIDESEEDKLSPLKDGSIVELGEKTSEPEREKLAESKEGIAEAADENVRNEAQISQESESPDHFTGGMDVIMQEPIENEIEVESENDPAAGSLELAGNLPPNLELEGSNYFAPTCTSDIEDDLESVVSSGRDVQNELPLVVESPAMVTKDIQDVEEMDLELLENKENHNISKNKDEHISEKEVTKRTQRQILVESEPPKPALRDCSVVLQRIVLHVDPCYSSDEEEENSVMPLAEEVIDTSSTSVVPKSSLPESFKEINRSVSSEAKETCPGSESVTKSSMSEFANDRSSKVAIPAEISPSKASLNSSAMSRPSDEEKMGKESQDEVSLSASPSRSDKLEERIAENIEECMVENIEECMAENLEECMAENMEAGIEPEIIPPEASSPRKVGSIREKSDTDSTNPMKRDLFSSAERTCTAKISPKSVSYRGRRGRKRASTDEELVEKAKPNLDSSMNSYAEVENIADKASNDDNHKEIPDSNLIPNVLPESSVTKQVPSTPAVSKDLNLTPFLSTSTSELYKGERKSKPFASTPKQSEATPVVTPGTIKNCSIILQRVNMSTDLSTPVTTRTRSKIYSAQKVTPAIAGSSASFGARKRQLNKAPSTPAKEDDSNHIEDTLSTKQTPVNKKSPEVASAHKSAKRINRKDAEFGVADNSHAQETSTLSETPVRAKTPRHNDVPVTPRNGRSRLMKAVEIVELEIDDDEAQEIDENTKSSASRSDSNVQPESDTSHKGRRGRPKRDNEDVFVKPRSPLKKSRRGRQHSHQHDSDSSSSASSTRFTRGRKKNLADVVTIDDDDHDSEKEESQDENEIRTRRVRVTKTSSRKVENQSDDDKVREGNKTSDSEGVNHVVGKSEVPVANDQNKEKQAPAKSKRGRARTADPVELDDEKPDHAIIQPEAKPKGRRGRRPVLIVSEEDEVVVGEKILGAPEPVQSTVDVVPAASVGIGTKGKRKGLKKVGKDSNPVMIAEEASKPKSLLAGLPETETAEVPSTSKVLTSKVSTDVGNTNVKVANHMSCEPFVKIVPIDVSAVTTTRFTRQNKALVETDEQVTNSSSRMPKRQKIEIKSSPKSELPTEKKETKVRGRGGKKTEKVDHVETYLEVKTTRSNRRKKIDYEDTNNVSDVDDGTESDHTKTGASRSKTNRGNARPKKANEDAVITVPDESDNDDDAGNQSSSPQKKHPEASKIKPSSRSKRGRKNTVEEREKEEEEEEEEEPKAKRGRRNNKVQEPVVMEEPKANKTRVVNRKKVVAVAEDISDSDHGEAEKGEETNNKPSRNRNRPHAKDENPELEKPKTKSTATRRGGRGNAKPVKSSASEENDTDAEEKEPVVPKVNHIKSRGRKNVEVNNDEEEERIDVKKPEGRRRVPRNGKLPEPIKEEKQIDPSDDEVDLEEKLSSPIKKVGKGSGSENKKNKPIPSSSSNRATDVQHPNKGASQNDESSDESQKQSTNRGLKRNQRQKKIVEEREISESESEVPSISLHKASTGRGRTRKDVQEKESKSKATKSSNKNGSSPRVVLQLAVTGKKEPEVVDLLSDDEEEIEPENPIKRLRYTAKEGDKPNSVSKSTKTKVTRKKRK